MKKRFRRIGLCLSLGMILFPSVLWAAESYVIIPFLDMTQIYGENKQIASPYTFRVYRTGTVEVDGPMIVANEFQRQLISVLEYSIQSLAQGERAVNEVLKKNPKLVNSPRELAVQTGKELKVDYVIVGAVYVYRERVGHNYSVDTPASISFEISLYRTSDGARMWTQSATETQQPLSENVLKIGQFMKRKATWLTAEALTATHIQEMIPTFPFAREVLERKAQEEMGTLPPTKQAAGE